MSDKRLKIKKTDVVLNGIVYRPTKAGYGVCTYTEDLPDTVVVADRIGDTPVTALLRSCFSDSTISAISLPDSLQEIDDGAFRHCTNLLEVKVPDDVRVIGSFVFKQCKSLRRLELGRHTKQAGWNLCESCKSIEEFVLWNELEYIGANLFWQGGKKLKYTEYSYGLYLGNPENPYVMLDKNVPIEESDRELVVEIHPDTKFITSGAFNRLCDGAVPFADIDKLVIHNNVVNIDGGAFDMSFFGTTGIKTICADSIEMLCKAGGGILENSRRLLIHGQEIRDLVIPKTVKKIATDTFAKCGWLESVTFEGDIDDIGYRAFRDNTNLKKISFPPNVGTIQSDAFRDCPRLEKLELFRVEEVGFQAFAADGSSLLPRLPEEMRNAHLQKHKKRGLKEVIFHDEIGSLAGNAFAMNMGLETLTGMENVKRIVATGIHEDPFLYTPFEGKFVK